MADLRLPELQVVVTDRPLLLFHLLLALQQAGQCRRPLLARTYTAAASEERDEMGLLGTEQTEAVCGMETNRWLPRA